MGGALLTGAITKATASFSTPKVLARQSRRVLTDTFATTRGISS